MRSSLYDISSTAWRGMRHSGISVIKVGYIFTRLHAQCYSAQRARSLRSPKLDPQPPTEEGSDAQRPHSSRSPKLDPQPSTDEGNDAFFVVRKGDTIGIYKNLSDCQAQVCDPSVSVYKGNSLCKETEEYLASRGLKGALYSINAVNAKENLFGTLVPCSFINTCIIEFDGASKGNPGKAGAGAILRTEDGHVISRLREGLVVVTNNVAEYRALIMGLREALKKGFNEISVQGDSKLVYMQVSDLWRVKDQNMPELCKEVKELKDGFLSFKISHVKREFNSDANAQANFAVDLPSGEFYEESSKPS